MDLKDFNPFMLGGGREAIDWSAFQTNSSSNVAASSASFWASNVNSNVPNYIEPPLTLPNNNQQNNNSASSATIAGPILVFIGLIILLLAAAKAYKTRHAQKAGNEDEDEEKTPRVRFA